MTRHLTTREKQIAELIYFGATEKEISCHLDIAVDTVKSHKRSLFVKTGSRNIADVTRWYVCDKTGVSINPSETARRLMTCMLLFLILVLEATHADFIRPVRTRTRTLTQTRAQSKTFKRARKDYQLTA